MIYTPDYSLSPIGTHHRKISLLDVDFLLGIIAYKLMKLAK